MVQPFQGAHCCRVESDLAAQLPADYATIPVVGKSQQPIGGLADGTDKLRAVWTGLWKHGRPARFRVCERICLDEEANGQYAAESEDTGE